MQLQQLYRVGLMTFSFAFIVIIIAQVVPSRYLFRGQSVNGSSATGHCSNFTTNDNVTTCTQPTTSVLLDGNIPQLTGLDGDTWASQLLTVQETNPAGTDIIFDFTTTPNFLRVKEMRLAMFNCPEWGIAVQTVGILTGSSISENGSLSGVFNPPNTSCDSLVSMCLSQSTTDPVITLKFFPPPGADWLHLAEVTFYGNVGRCTTTPTTSATTQFGMPLITTLRM